MFSKVVLSSSSLGFLKVCLSKCFFEYWLLFHSFSVVAIFRSCLLISLIIINDSSIYQVINSRNEPTLCLQMTGCLADDLLTFLQLNLQNLQKITHFTGVVVFLHQQSDSQKILAENLLNPSMMCSVHYK